MSNKEQDLLGAEIEFSALRPNMFVQVATASDGPMLGLVTKVRNDHQTQSIRLNCAQGSVTRHILLEDIVELRQVTEPIRLPKAPDGFYVVSDQPGAVYRLDEIGWSKWGAMDDVSVLSQVEMKWELAMGGVLERLRPAQR